MRNKLAHNEMDQSCFRTTGKSLRRQNGSQMVEFAFSAICLIAVSLLLLDCSLLLYAAYANQSVCREAAVAAASGPPAAIQTDSPRLRANSILKHYCTGQGFFCLHPDSVVSETITGPLPGPSLGGAVNGQVTVQTIADVNLPFFLFFRPSSMSLSATQTYPYTYALAASADNKAAAK